MRRLCGIGRFCRAVECSLERVVVLGRGGGTGFGVGLLLFGLFLLWGGINVWRRCRRRMRRQHGNELSLSPQLLKKRD